MAERAKGNEPVIGLDGRAQDEVVAFLSDPANHADQPKAVERVDTHAAIIFLAGDTAYKIKRAVKLPYLDFSTLDKRKRVCEREIEINTRTAPEIYLCVVAIARQPNGHLAFKSTGEVVEWAIKMKRFDDSLLLDALARKDALHIQLMPVLAEVIAGYHREARRSFEIDGADHLAPTVSSTTKSLLGAGAILGTRHPAEFSRALHVAWKQHSELLRERARRGFVRRCHGDMHLKNVVLLDGKPTLFDALEFDDDLATIDVLYDLAFLLMDLWHRGLRRHANVVLNRYFYKQHEPQDSAGLAALPLFLALRAAVRAMVSIDRLPHVDETQKSGVEDDIRSYFALAEGFLKPQPPRLVAVGGLSGTGKTTVAAGLAPGIGLVPGAFHIRSDVERKVLFGVDELTRLDAVSYTADASDRVYRHISERAADILETGHSVIVDAVFARASERAAIEQVAQDAGAGFTGIWLEAPQAMLEERVSQRQGDASDADVGVVRQQSQYDVGTMSWSRVDASGTPSAVLKRAALPIGAN